MLYFIILLLILGVVLGMFALAKGEGNKYSRNNMKSDRGDDHFNSFTL